MYIMGQNAGLGSVILMISAYNFRSAAAAMSAVLALS